MGSRGATSRTVGGTGRLALRAAAAAFLGVLASLILPMPMPEEEPAAVELRRRPHPLYRYADPDSGLLDGGLFVLSYGNNPEVVLLLELRRTGKAAPAYCYGLARLAAAELKVRLGDQEVWQMPAVTQQQPENPYWIHAQPVQAPRTVATTVLHGHAGQVWFAAWGPDGQTLATGGDDGTVRLWRGAQGLARPYFVARTSNVISIAYAPDGKRLATGCNDRAVRVWDLAGGRPPLELRGHTRAVRSVAGSPDGKIVASASKDQTVRLWDLSQPPPSPGAVAARLAPPAS